MHKPYSIHTLLIHDTAHIHKPYITPHVIHTTYTYIHIHTHTTYTYIHTLHTYTYFYTHSLSRFPSLSPSHTHTFTIVLTHSRPPPSPPKKKDLAKMATISGVPGVAQSKLLKNAINGNKGAAGMSIYGTRIPKARKTIFSGDGQVFLRERESDTHVRVGIRVRVCVCECVHTFVNMHMYMYVCARARVCICSYIYIYIHSYVIQISSSLYFHSSFVHLLPLIRFYLYFPC